MTPSVRGYAAQSRLAVTVEQGFRMMEISIGVEYEKSQPKAHISIFEPVTQGRQLQRDQRYKAS